MALLNELPLAVELEVIQASSYPSCLVMVKVWFEMAVEVCESVKCLHLQGLFCRVKFGAAG